MSDPPRLPDWALAEVAGWPLDAWGVAQARLLLRDGTVLLPWRSCRAATSWGGEGPARCPSRRRHRRHRARRRVRCLLARAGVDWRSWRTTSAVRGSASFVIGGIVGGAAGLAAGKLRARRVQGGEAGPAGAGRVRGGAMLPRAGRGAARAGAALTVWRHPSGTQTSGLSGRCRAHGVYRGRARACGGGRGRRLHLDPGRRRRPGHPVSRDPPARARRVPGRPGAGRPGGAPPGDQAPAGSAHPRRVDAGHGWLRGVPRDPGGGRYGRPTR